jgi:tetratricopeptide (TPR) repeat protein
MFVASSSESLKLAYAVQRNLQGSVEITVWSQGAFKPSTTTSESLAGLLDSSDFALFVFSPDDVTIVRGNESSSVRDNVIYELGLFTGKLGKERCFILTPDNESPRIPTDLYGLTLIKYEANRSDGNLEAATGAACFQIQERIPSLGFRSQSSGTPAAEPQQKETIDEAEAEKRTLAESSAEGPSTETDKYRWLYAYIEKSYQEARQLLAERIREEHDEEERINLESWIGRIIESEDPGKGEEHLVSMIEKYPESSSPFVHLARIYHSRQQYSQALATVEKGLSSTKDGPKRVTLILMKAEFLIEAGRLQEGLNTLKDGVENYPDVEQIYIDLSEYMKKAGDFVTARDILEHGLPKVSNKENLLYALAKLLYESSEINESLVRYNSLLEISPENPTYLTLRANIFLDLELYDLAFRDYMQANVLAEGKQDWILGNIGNLLKNRGFYRESISYFSRALSLSPDNQYAHERMAHSLSMRDEEDKKFADICRLAKRKMAERLANLPATVKLLHSIVPEREPEA